MAHYDIVKFIELFSATFDWKIYNFLKRLEDTTL